jgi:hypothetical protein
MKKNELKAIITEKCSGETIVIFRSAFSEFTGFFYVIILVAMASYLTFIYPWSLQHAEISIPDLFAFSVPVPLFALIPLTMLLRVFHNLFDCRYIICDEYVLEVDGLWSFARKSVRINYIHIRGIEIDESFNQRLLGLGDIAILGVADQGHPSIVMRGVAKPRQIKDIIQERVTRQLSGIRVAPVAG